MPITTIVSHLDRIIIGTARGEVTVKDIAGFAGGIVRPGLLHYRKQLSLTDGVLRIAADEVRALAQALGEIKQERTRGPLAIVANPDQEEMAGLFAAIGSDFHPVRVCPSIREARQWLDTFTVS